MSKMKRTAKAWGKILLVLAAAALVVFTSAMKWQICMNHYEKDLGMSYSEALSGI